MRIIGLTGPTGSGKSLVSEVAKAEGYQVINCDLIARKATEKGSYGLLCLVAAFGEEILNNDDTLNRKELAKIAFSSKENTELLNKTLLPHIVKLVNENIVADKVLLDAPTLFESGIDSECELTVAVLADKKIRKQRIISRDNITETEAELRINAGKSDEFYKLKADYIIYNNGNIEEFKAKFLEILDNGGNKDE
ncbi:MAG: dephospho-CoA kinase [Ruminococcaceae bacterium]|nr:dephospho-CoA kinase [Oscillospiraceae bacterium]